MPRVPRVVLVPAFYCTLYAVNWNFNSTATNQLFYVSKENIVREVIISNITDIWDSGPSTELKFRTPTFGGFAGCAYGDFNNRAPDDTNRRGTVNVWVADKSSYRQYILSNDGSGLWVVGENWQGKNTYAGVGCYLDEGNTSYTMMAGQDNSVEIYWKNSTNPLVGKSNPTEGLIRDIYLATPLHFSTYLYAQMDDRSIRVFNVSFAAENTTIVAMDELTDSSGQSATGIGGTRLAATALTERNDDGEVLWESLFVFYQTKGNDITVFTRPIEGGEWSSGRLKISDI